MAGALNREEDEMVPPDSPATPVTPTVPEDMSAHTSRPSENGLAALDFSAPLTPSTPQDNVVTDPHTPNGPQLFEIARRATELVVDGTEDQLARVSAKQRAIIQARILADFAMFMHRAVGEYANQLE